LKRGRDVTDVDLAQQVNIRVNVLMEELNVHVLGDADAPYVSMSAARLGVAVQMRTFDTTVDAFLGNVIVHHRNYKGMLMKHLSDNFYLSAQT
jgi:hypothetical protein